MVRAPEKETVDEALVTVSDMEKAIVEGESAKKHLLTKRLARRPAAEKPCC